MMPSVGALGERRLIGVYAATALIWLIGIAAASYRRRTDDGRLLYDLLLVLAYLPILLGFFWQPIFLEGISVPRGGGDLASFIYPLYSFAARSVQDGIIPLWNPHLYAGSPFAADMQTGLFYPINFLAFLLARPFSYGTLQELAFFHYFLAAVFTFFYLRNLGAQRLSAFAGGVVFAFGGFAVAHLGHLNMLEAAVWLPLVLLFFDLALGRAQLWAAVVAGAIFGISILPGHTQITLFYGLTLALYWLWHLLAAARIEKRPELSSRFPKLKRAATLPVCLAVALGAAALQLLPSYELTRMSLRADITYAKAAEYAASPVGLITLAVPHFFGDNPAAFWGLSWNLTEVYGYVGILPLLLAPVALLVARQRRSAALFFAGFAALSLMLAVGEYSILHGWLYKFVPGFDKVRSAGRFLLLFDFSIAVLATFAIDSFAQKLRARERPTYRIVLLVASVLLGGAALVAGPYFYTALLTSQDKDPAIFDRVRTSVNSVNMSILFLGAGVVLLYLHRYLRRGRAAIAYLALALIVVDLFSANGRYNPTTDDVTAAYRHPEIVDFLRNQPVRGRVDTVTGIWDIWQPDTSLLGGIDDVMGIYNPMLLADFNRYWENLGSRSVPGYDMLNARYVIARKDVTLDWAKFKPALMDVSQLNVYENTTALPRAMLVPSAEVTSREKMLERLRSADFDPRHTVLLDEGSKSAAEASSLTFQGNVGTIEYPSVNEVAIRATGNRSAYLVLNEVWYPGWRVFVDGQEAQLLRANYVFRAVAFPAGDHEVRFAFSPRIWQIGLAITAVTWLIVIVVGGLRLQPMLHRRS
ncbi:MAG: YfhO family protein [Chloroflexi bacterium]|nr:YfhO family protein [Chloroflexota bacterium]